MGHAVLIMVYYIIRDGAHYYEMGADHFDRLDRKTVATRLKKRLETLGYQVELTDLERVAA